MEINLEQAHLHKLLRDPAKRDEGFRRLMKIYGERLYWHIRRIVVGHDDAEDVLQETCIKILSAINSLHSMGPALTSKLEAENQIDGQVVEMAFQKALLTLPTQQRIAFYMRYYDEMSYDEIASITGKNIGTLKTNYHYATEKIKKYIQNNSL